MFFFLSKVFDVLLAPLTWCFILLGVGMWAARKKRARLATGAPIAAVALLYVFSVQPVSNGLVYALESSAIDTSKRDVTYDAVIVLTGFVDGEASASWGDRDYSDAVERMLVAYDLLRAGRAKVALLSGGTVDPGVTAPEAETLAQQLASWGVDEARLVVEPRSKNTYENAVECAKIVRERALSRLLLVTSAMHMKRAAGCFRAQGLDFDVLPVDHRSYTLARIHGSFLPRADKLSTSTFALRELFGRAIYRVRGYSVAWP